jgi:Flp pilus assembly protein TadG
MMKLSRRTESGQVLVIVALLFPMLLGMVALAVDLGNYAAERRTLQNSADSIALAASRDLPDAAQAVASGKAWATKNGVALSDVTITVTQPTTGDPNPKVTVDIQKKHAFAFAKVIGISSRNVGAHAAAIKTSPGGLAGLSPWSVLESAQAAATPGDLVTLKYDANDPTNGNFGIVQIDGSGSSVYLDSIENTTTSTVCAQGATDCTDTSPVCTVDVCPSQTGNKVGPTRTGADYLLANTDPHCDTFAEAFSGPVNGKYELNTQCNPWLDGSYPSLRVILIPVINSLCNGSCNVTVVSFALFWLEGYQAGACTGNSCEIQGRFVNADINVHALAGVYDPDSSIHFVRLVE